MRNLHEVVKLLKKVPWCRLLHISTHPPPLSSTHERLTKILCEKAFKVRIRYFLWQAPVIKYMTDQLIINPKFHTQIKITPPFFKHLILIGVVLQNGVLFRNQTIKWWRSISGADRFVYRNDTYFCYLEGDNNKFLKFHMTNSS